MNSFELYQAAIRVLQDCNAVGQCVLHPDSYYTILEDIPSGIEKLEARVVVSADVELDRVALHSLVPEVFNTLPGECRECEKISKE
jgi:hypothetical protein